MREVPRSVRKNQDLDQVDPASSAGVEIAERLPLPLKRTSSQVLAWRMPSLRCPASRLDFHRDEHVTIECDEVEFCLRSSNLAAE